LLWVQDKNIFAMEKYRKIIEDQESVGVSVFIAEKEEVPDDLEEDYGIVDESYSYIMTFKNGKPDTDKISVSPEQTRKLLQNFRKLEKFALRSNAYYKQLDQYIKP